VSSLDSISLEDFSYIYNLNVRAIFLISKVISKYLYLPRRFINVSAVRARLEFKDLSIYYSSKAAVEGLTRYLTVELRLKGITVNLIEPGPV